MEIASSLSIVIPAYNEAQRVGQTIQKICDYFGKKAQLFEIIVINDGSRDNTVNIVLDLSKKGKNVALLENSTNKGKGASIKKGIFHAAHDLILVTDADLSTPIEEFEKLVPWIQQGYDIVLGSRGLKESEIILRQPWYRRTIGRVFNLLVKALIVSDFSDTQCGFKLFTSEAATRIFSLSKIERFAFDVEVLFIAKKMGYKTKEVPVRWMNSPHSRVNALRDPFGMFLDLLRIRFFDLTE